MSTKDERGKKIRWLEGILVTILFGVVADIHYTSKAIHSKLDGLLLTVTRLDVEQAHIKQDIDSLEANHISIKGDIQYLYKALKR